MSLSVQPVPELALDDSDALLEEPSAGGPERGGEAPVAPGPAAGERAPVARWYAVQVASSCEKKVKATLEQRAVTLGVDNR
ncbi:MAG: transcription termination/antitermination protein NusG, partial [Cyanobium sp.]